MKTVGLLWRASPPGMAVAVFLVILSALARPAASIVSGLMVGAIPGALRGHGLGSGASRHLVAMLLLVGAVGVVTVGLGQCQAYVVARLGSRWTFHLRRWAMRQALTPPGLAHLEDPKFKDEFALAMSTPGASPEQVPQALLAIAGQRLAGVCQGLLLAGFHLWAPLLIAAAMLAQNAYANAELDLLFHFYGSVTPQTRRSNYFRDLAMSPAAAKETRVFGLASWLVDGFTLPWVATMRGVWAKRRALWWRMMGQGFLEVAAFGTVFLLLAIAGAHGTISLGATVTYLGAAQGMRGLGIVGDAQLPLRNGANALTHLLGLSGLPSVARATLSGTHPAGPASPEHEIAFDAVSFRYPGAEHAVFKGLDLTLRAGTSTAIVGANGAGKTTLVKLLSRLYDPDSGRVSVDGVDLAEIDPLSWHRRVAVVFQDFVQYPFNAVDNIALGARQAYTRDGIEEVARLAGVDEILDALPSGWETLLTKKFKGGVDLSGGQWQKVALARGLLAARDGGVLVLDEPTAALDVRSEAAFFDRFFEMTAGVTALVISHRFSTVRRAQRICVLDGGRLVEAGTHEELLELRGHYARMFRLQADRFVGPSGGSAGGLGG